MSEKEREVRQRLINQEKQNTEVTVSHIYKLSKQQLKALFVSDNLQNQLNELKDHGSTKGVLKKLASEASTGIVGDEKDLRRRKDVFGKNFKPLPQRASLLESIKETASDKLWWVVMGSAVLSCICGWIANGVAGLAEGVSIIAAIILIICIASWADWFKDSRFVSLQETMLDMTCPVIRGKFGATQTVSVWDIVVGDVVLLQAGDRVAADCIIIESADCVAEQPQPEANEDAEPPKKEQKSAVGVPGGSGDPFLFADCLLVRGQCKAVVCAVGKDSTRGDKRQKLATDVDTALQTKLKNLANRFTIYALYGALLVFVVLSITLIITLCNVPADKGKNKDEPGWGAILFAKLAAQVNVCVILIVVSVPEGLPLTVGVSLAFSVKKMLADKILIRQLDGPEKMGAVEEICTSKTGTLTKGKMKVNSYYVENRDIKNSRPNTFQNCDLNQHTLDRIQDSILYNTEARVEMDATTYIPVGSGTEVCLIRFLQDAGIPVHLLIQRKLGRIRGISPFTSETKISVVALVSPTDATQVVVYVKGAPEVVIEMSDKIIGANGESTVLSSTQKEELTSYNGIIATMAAQPLHVLGFAYTEIDLENWESQYENQHTSTEKALEDALSSGQLKLTYLTTFGLKDSLREVVNSVIQHIKEEGNINVRMISGDHLQTAQAVALKAGIIDENDLHDQYAVMSAENFRATVGSLHVYTDEEGNEIAQVENETSFAEVIESLKVIGRATAADKHLLVAGLKGMGKKVAVTGGDINDVSALQRADVGLAMGSGCAAAKEASSLVLTDDDIQASLKSIMWGRNIFHNVARFLQFQITVNISIIWTVFIGACFFAETPISPVGLLWINLIMDTFAALALATEPPLKNVIKGGKKEDSEGGATILSNWVWRQIIGISILNMTIMTVMVFFGSMIADLHFTNATPLAFDEPDHFNSKLAYADQDAAGAMYLESLDKRRLFSYIFNTFVFLQLTNEINCRKVGPSEFNVFEAPFHNFYFLVVWGGTIATQVCIVQWLPNWFSVAPLSRGEWGSCMIISITPLIFSAIFKFTPDTWPQKLCCNRLPSEDENVDDHPILKAWSKTQSAIKSEKKPSSQPVEGHMDGEEMEAATHVDEEDGGNGNDNFKQI